MNIQEHLISCLGEEATEVALELAKVSSKTNRFGINDRNTENPSGPTNAERLVAELNDLLAVADLLASHGVIPTAWRDATAQETKKQRVVRFLHYAESTGALKHDDEPPTLPRINPPLPDKYDFSFTKADLEALELMPKYPRPQPPYNQEAPYPRA